MKRNILIVISCFALYTFLKGYTAFAMTIMYNFLAYNSLTELLSCLINLLFPIIPILIGYKLLNEKGNFWKRIGLQGNAKEGFAVGGILFLAGWIISAFSLAYLRGLSYFSSIIYIFTDIFFVELCARAFFFRKMKDYTQWGFLRITLVYLATLGVTAIALAFLAFQYEKTTFAKILEELPAGFTTDILPVLLVSFVTLVLRECFYYWLYLEWKLNFWVVVCVHFAVMFGSTLSPNYRNLESISLLLLIATGVIGTIIYKRKHQLPLEVKKWW